MDNPKSQSYTYGEARRAEKAKEIKELIKTRENKELIWSKCKHYLDVVVPFFGESPDELFTRDPEAYKRLKQAMIDSSKLKEESKKW